MGSRIPRLEPRPACSGANTAWTGAHGFHRVAFLELRLGRAPAARDEQRSEAPSSEGGLAVGSRSERSRTAVSAYHAIEESTIRVRRRRFRSSASHFLAAPFGDQTCHGDPHARYWRSIRPYPPKR